ncbi:MAG TPA: hypothetical protein VHL11_11755 [Phototrophicaceae bacterium]|jgi:hypothetical protein|nr:hypothetical protein [Phototrophicaceae bacterium]
MRPIARIASLVILLLLCCAAPAVHANPPQTEGANPFGIVEGMWFPDLTCDLGVGWERIIFDWSQHQPNGPDDWYTLSVDDRWLKAANACNREVVAIVKNVPAWATDDTPGAGVPRGLSLTIDDPGNVWARFMRKTAEYYGSRGVHRFIILNEPDISRETYGFEFEGELEDYFMMLKVGSLAAKEGNPDAVIHLAATTYWHDANTGKRLYMDRLLERIAQDPEAKTHNDYFDVFSLHIYFRTETIPQIVGIMRDILTKNGMGDKEIWINELNASPNEDPNWLVTRPQFQVNLEQQASFLIQASALALASGVDRIAVYKLYDQQLPPGAESFGLLTPGQDDKLPRPGFYAWKMVSHHLTGVIAARWTFTDTVDVVRLIHSDGRQTTLAWAKTATATQVEIGATGDKAVLIDQAGNLSLTHPSSGVYTLTLPGARCDEKDGCAIGGVVSTLVQSDGEALISEMTINGKTALEFKKTS